MLPHSPRIGRRRALPGAAALLVVLGLLLWWLLPLGDGSPSGSVTFSTGVTTGVYQRYGELLKKDLQGSAGSGVRAADQSGVAGEPRAGGGRARRTSPSRRPTRSPKYRQDGKPGAERLRGCARLYDDYVQLVVPKGSADRSSSADLRGKRVAVGQAGSGVRLIAERLLSAAGLDPVQDVDAGVRRDRHHAGAAGTRPARRVLLVGRPAHRGRCASCRSASTSGWSRSGASLKAAARHGRDGLALLPGGGDARGRLSRVPRTAAPCRPWQSPTCW